MTGTLIPKLYPWTIKNLKKLERFYFGSNFAVEKLTIDSGTFESFQFLHTLSLSMKNIQEMEIEDNAFKDLPNLVILDLNENSITKLNSKSFIDLPNLAYFSIEANKIDEVEKSFFDNFPNLVQFAAKDNICINETFYLNSPGEREFLKSFENCFSKWEESSKQTSVPPTELTTISTPRTTETTTLGASKTTMNFAVHLLILFISIFV